MGFERICAIIQGTSGLTDFSKLASNYNTDVFTPVFKKIEELSGHHYQGTLASDPSSLETSNLNLEIEQRDVAFRVIGDHIRTLSFSIADGILPSNQGRGYVPRKLIESQYFPDDGQGSMLDEEHRASSKDPFEDNSAKNTAL